MINIFISFSSACPAGWYGQDCEQVALCGEGAISDSVTGRCVCKISHQGEDCGQGLSYYNSVFLMIIIIIRVCGATITSIYLKVYLKNLLIFCVCMCVCVSGCAQGWFGEDCTQRCNCSNGALCDPVTGNCTCGLGWTGDNCDAGKLHKRGYK